MNVDCQNEAHCALFGSEIFCETTQQILLHTVSISFHLPKEHVEHGFYVDKKCMNSLKVPQVSEKVSFSVASSSARRTTLSASDAASWIRLSVAITITDQ